MDTASIVSSNEPLDNGDNIKIIMNYSCEITWPTQHIVHEDCKGTLICLKLVWIERSTHLRDINGEANGMI